MEEPKTLRVLARGTAKVPDFARMAAGTMASIGRKHGEVSPGVWGSVPTNEVVEIPNEQPYAAEYLKALRDGDLWAADEATARAAGSYVDEVTKKNVPYVVFDPTFGGAVVPKPAKAGDKPAEEKPKSALQQIPAKADEKKES